MVRLSSLTSVAPATVPSEPVEIECGDEIKVFEDKKDAIFVDFPHDEKQQEVISMYKIYTQHFALPVMFDPSSYRSYVDHQVTPITWAYSMSNTTITSIGPHKMSYGFMGMGAALGGKLKQLGPLKIEYSKDDKMDKDNMSMVGSYDLAYEKNREDQYERDNAENLKWIGELELVYGPKNTLMRIGTVPMKYGMMGRLNYIGRFALEYSYFGRLKGIRMYGEPLSEEVLIVVFFAIQHQLSEYAARQNHAAKLKQAAVVLARTWINYYDYFLRA